MSKNVLFLLLTMYLNAIEMYGQFVPNTFDTAVLDSAYQVASELDTKLEILMRLGEAYRVENTSRANEYYNEVISLGEPAGAYLFCAKASLMKAANAQVNYQLDSSLNYLNQGINYAQNAHDSDFMVYLLNNKALILAEVGQAYEGAQVLSQTLNYAKEKKDTAAIIQGITNLANLKGSTRDFNGTLSLIEREEPYWSLGDEFSQAKILYVRANALNTLGKYQESLTDYDKVYPILKQRAHKYNFALLLNNYTSALYSSDRMDSALLITEEAIQLSQSLNFTTTLGHAYLNKGNILLAQNKVDSAEANSERAMALFSRKENPTAYLLALESAKEIQTAKENWKRAKLYGDAYIRLKDSLDQVARVSQMDSLLISNEVEQKEQALETALSANDGLLKDRKSLMLSLIAAFILLAVISFFGYRKQKRIKRLAAEQSSKEALISQTKNELELMLLEVAKKEKDIMDLEKKLDVLEQQSRPIEDKLASADIFNILSRNVKKDADWKLFEQYFDSANPKFFAAIKADFPKVTPHDLRLMALLRLNLSPAEIAVLFNIAEDSVRKAKYRLSKKLDLAGDKEMHGFILRY